MPKNQNSKLAASSNKKVKEKRPKNTSTADPGGTKRKHTVYAGSGSNGKPGNKVYASLLLLNITDYVAGDKTTREKIMNRFQKRFEFLDHSGKRAGRVAIQRKLHLALGDTRKLNKKRKKDEMNQKDLVAESESDVTDAEKRDKIHEKEVKAESESEASTRSKKDETSGDDTKSDSKTASIKAFRSKQNPKFLKKKDFDTPLLQAKKKAKQSIRQDFSGDTDSTGNDGESPPKENHKRNVVRRVKTIKRKTVKKKELPMAKRRPKSKSNLKSSTVEKSWKLDLALIKKNAAMKATEIENNFNSIKNTTMREHVAPYTTWY